MSGKWNRSGVALFAAILLCGAVLSSGAEQDSKHKRDAAKGEKWMIGDFHNHTTFTDGSWPMNDLTGPATIAPYAYPDTSGLYKQGTAPTGFRNGLDFFTNSEHGGIRANDGFGNPWTSYSPFPSIGDPTAGRMWRWQSLIRTSDIPGYSNSHTWAHTTGSKPFVPTTRTRSS